MYRYNIDSKLVTSPIPLQGETPLTMTDAEAKHCIGFNANGNPVYNQIAIDSELQIIKQKQIDTINSEFDKQCSKIGIVFEGVFSDVNGNEITNPLFQYDDLSQNRLLKFKDIEACNFWRSVNNKNIVLSNLQKNSLYLKLLITWATKFAEKSQEIDSL